MKHIVFWLLLSCSLAFAQRTEGTLRFGAETRHYTQFVPETQSSKPLPLVVALHGRGGTGAGMAALTGFDTLAAREGFAVLYPDGLENEWHYVDGIPGYPPGPDDLGFLDALIEKLASTVAIDPAHIYVTGFSNGGFMAQRLACSASERYAAFASVGAAGFGGMDRVCPAHQPVRMLLIHGTDDTNIPWAGMSRQVGGRSVPVLYPVAATMEFWANYAGCEAKLDKTELPTLRITPETRIHHFVFTACPVGAAVELYGVENGGHNWPGHLDMLPEEVAGVVSTELDASVAIWDFFSEQGD
jgi:polyhydroxybutyrate depolymerase